MDFIAYKLGVIIYKKARKQQHINATGPINIIELLKVIYLEFCCQWYSVYLRRLKNLTNSWGSKTFNYVQYEVNLFVIEPFEKLVRLLKGIKTAF